MRIENNIFLIWFGHYIPINIKYVFNAFQLMNPHMNCNLIYRSIDYINNINSYTENKIDNILLDSINIIKKHNDNNNIKWKNFIDNQIKLYGKNIRFIQLLSDVFRVLILQNFGGIYIDCDTFPIKRFDEQLLKHSFCVMSHQGNSHQTHIDNYFFGLSKGCKYVPYTDFIKNMVLIDQTTFNQRLSIDFYKRKFKFKNMTLTSSDFLPNTSFYIEHYSSCNWKYNFTSIPLCKYDFI